MLGAVQQTLKFPVRTVDVTLPNIVKFPNSRPSSIQRVVIYVRKSTRQDDIGITFRVHLERGILPNSLGL